MEEPWEVMRAPLNGRWLERLSAGRVRGDTKIASKAEDRNGLGIREPMQGDTWV